MMPPRRLNLYVEEKVHENGDTIVVTEAFLNSVCQQLEQAHSMHSQLQAVSEGLTVLPPSSLTPAVVNAMRQYVAYEYGSHMKAKARLNLLSGSYSTTSWNWPGSCQSCSVHGDPRTVLRLKSPLHNGFVRMQPVRVALT